MERVDFSDALEAVFRVVSQANQFIELASPWKLAKQADGAGRLQHVLRALAEVIRIVAIVLEPCMPSVASAIWQQLGCGMSPRTLQGAASWLGLTTGQPIGPHPVLFPKPGK
jgi:methionyl-tRNA synthetase